MCDTTVAFDAGRAQSSESSAVSLLFEESFTATAPTEARCVINDAVIK